MAGITSSTQPRNHYRMWEAGKMAVSRLLVPSSGSATLDTTAFVRWNIDAEGGPALEACDVSSGQAWGMWIIVNGATETLAAGDIEDGVVKVVFANHATLGGSPVDIGPNMAAGTESFFEGWRTSMPLKFNHVSGGDDIEVLVYVTFDAVT